MTQQKGSGDDVEETTPKKSETWVPQTIDVDDIDREGVQKQENPTYQKLTQFGINLGVVLAAKLATILLFGVFFRGRFLGLISRGSGEPKKWCEEQNTRLVNSPTAPKETVIRRFLGSLVPWKGWLKHALVPKGTVADYVILYYIVL